MYENADKIIELLNKESIKQFRRLKTLSFDKANVLGNTAKTYTKIDEYARRMFRELAKKVGDDVYKQYADKDAEDDFDDLLDAWLLGVLDGYSPTLKYVYSHEVDRKRSRCAESIIAVQDNGENPSKEVDTALRLWTNMTSQYADDIEWEATIGMYKELGYEKVKWVTEKDDRVCKVCKERDGKVYRISNIPFKPHIGCRCAVIPIKKGKQ